MAATGSIPLRKVAARTKVRRGKVKAPVETETEEKATKRTNDPSLKMGRRTVAQAAKAEASRAKEAKTAVLETLRCARCISGESAKPVKVAREDTTLHAVSFNEVIAQRDVIAFSRITNPTQQQRREVTMTKATHRTTKNRRKVRVKSDVAEAKAGATTVSAVKHQEARQSAFRAPG